MYTEALSISVKRSNPDAPSIVRGAGCHLFDEAGRSYLDMSGGSGAANLGYSRPEVIDAIQRQAECLIHTGWNIDNPQRHEMIRKLAHLLPYESASVMGGVTGAEGIEIAAKIARARTGRDKILYFGNAFHGKTQGALSVTANPAFRTHLAATLRDNPRFALDDTYEGGPQDFDRWTKAFRHHLGALKTGGELPAAILVEPIQAAEGIHPVPEPVLEAILAAGREFEVVTIFDEIYTGFGRTGTPFASHIDLKPDMIVIGKALGNGLPVSAVAGAPDLVDGIGYAEHSSTFTFSPLVCAVASRVLDIYLTEKPWEHATEMGAYLTGRLREVAAADARVSRIRGRGLMLAFDVVDEAAASPVIGPLRAKLEQAGVIVRTGGLRASTVKITPPLVIGKCEADAFIAILSGALATL
ncbi:aspartate aminotransferase family protein [Burkholderia sp. JP2-270]|uniref:aspartate aminotransferase family protein n=1 Tax=Burkholderia sp. JP2-270 TaxID=2217913 RepID=UPI000DA2F507|nr:aspartate aminotransferase family protein [Burkholderia sp. JP2-270]AWV02727.1 aspartate aminotransferase family protein [Burkholderia sp. JP2-270]